VSVHGKVLYVGKKHNAPIWVFAKVPWLDNIISASIGAPHQVPRSEQGLL